MYNKITGGISVDIDKMGDRDEDTDKDDRNDKPSFDYLIKMPIYSLSIDKLSQLKKELLPLKEKYDELFETTIQTLWMNDISVISRELEVLSDKWNKSYKQGSKGIKVVMPKSKK
jgi:hypothetical protein